jgi:HlyD family secretion protein
MPNTIQGDQDPLQKIVSSQHSVTYFGLTRTRWLIVLGVTFILAASYYLYARNTATSTRYLTEEVTLGDITVTVSATGNLQPTNQVDIGSELSGTVNSVLVDENDRVKKGQLLAQLDLSKLNDQVTRSRAALTSAEAQVAQTQATIEESRASLARLQQLINLPGSSAISRADLDAAQANYQRAVANEAGARAAVSQARAALQSDQTNLTKASIRSPIDGIVLARKVEPGQTVAASLQAPVLFTLAEDLTQMELQVDVDEADVGQVREGQSAIFNVDAYPGREYPAQIIRVSFGSQVKDGVVSYKTILRAGNDDLSLRPGMTATAEITTSKRDQVLLIPNAALRFTPPAKTDNKKNSSFVSSLMPRPPGTTSSRQANHGTRQVWILQNNQPVAVSVTTGISNGSQTEVTGDLKPGMQVITESIVPKK